MIQEAKLMMELYKKRANPPLHGHLGDWRKELKGRSSPARLHDAQERKTPPSAYRRIQTGMRVHVTPS